MYFSSWIRINKCFVYMNGPLTIDRYVNLAVYTYYKVIILSTFLSFDALNMNLGAAWYYLMPYTNYISLGFRRPNMSWPSKFYTKSWLWIPYLTFMFKPTLVDINLRAFNSYRLIFVFVISSLFTTNNKFVCSSYYPIFHIKTNGNKNNTVLFPNILCSW